MHWIWMLICEPEVVNRNSSLYESTSKNYPELKLWITKLRFRSKICWKLKFSSFGSGKRLWTMKRIINVQSKFEILTVPVRQYLQLLKDEGFHFLFTCYFHNFSLVISFILCPFRNCVLQNLIQVWDNELFSSSLAMMTNRLLTRSLHFESVHNGSARQVVTHYNHSHRPNTHAHTHTHYIAYIKTIKCSNAWFGRNRIHSYPVCQCKYFQTQCYSVWKNCVNNFVVCIQHLEEIIFVSNSPTGL